MSLEQSNNPQNSKSQKYILHTDYFCVFLYGRKLTWKIKVRFKEMVVLSIYTHTHTLLA